MSDTIKPRTATIQDADLLLEWRNDPKTRKASHNMEEVQRDEHISWLIKTLNNRNRRLLIAEESGVPIGTIRADYSNGMFELLWTVAPNARGRGVGKIMVDLLASQITEPIRSEVYAGNEASMRIAEYAGMLYDREEENGLLHYRRTALK